MWKAILFLAGIAVAPALLNGRQDAETPAPSSAPIPLAIKERLSGLLPKAAEVGATVSGERQFYSSNLYEYIDGAADAFLQDDLVAMVHQEYKTPQADVTVDIYDMGKPLNAFGMYAAERSPSYHFVPIGAEGYVSDFIVNFFQAEYYVKLSGFSDKPNSSPDLDRFAQAVSQKIGVGRSMPEALTLLPPQGLLPHTEKFVKRAPLGHEILSPAIEGSYSLEGSEGAAGKPTTLLISKAPGPAGAVQRVNRLRDYFSQSGKVTPAPEVIADGFRGTNQYEGEALVFARGPYAILCISPPPHPEQFLATVLDRLARAGNGAF